MTESPTARGRCTSRRSTIPVRVGALALIGTGALLAAGACCEDHELGVGDLDGRMAFGADVTADVKFDSDAEIAWDSDASFSSWAHLGTGANGKVDLDTDGLRAYEVTQKVDIDNDGVDESVSFVAFGEDGPDDAEQVFATWHGDKYTFDSGNCYLLWSKEDTVTMLSGPCVEGDDGSLFLSCTLETGQSDDFGCAACISAEKCLTCEDGQSVASCMTHGKQEIDYDAPSGGSAGAAGAGTSGSSEGGYNESGRGGTAGEVSPGGAGASGDAGKRDLGPAGGGSAGAGGARGGDETGGSIASGGTPPGVGGGGGGADTSSGGGISPGIGGTPGDSGTGGTQSTTTGGSGGTPNQGGPSTEEWELCLSLADLLGAAGDVCGLDKLGSDEALCTDSLDAVSECYAAFDDVGLFENPCSVLRSAVSCGSVFE